MTCDELRQDYPSYALGIADDPERTGIAEHLARKCPACVAGVTSAMATVTAISGAVPLTEPPRHLRRRVIVSVEREPKRFRPGIFVPWAIIAALSIALVAIGVSGKRQSGDTPKLQQALSILNDPTTRDVTFGQTEEPSPTPWQGRIFVNYSSGVVFVATRLPPIDSGKTFELWVTPAGGNPTPGGVFRSQPDGTAVFVRPGPAFDTVAIAVTVEPEGGSPQPTTTPIIMTRF